MHNLAYFFKVSGFTVKTAPAFAGLLFSLVGVLPRSSSAETSLTAASSAANYSNRINTVLTRKDPGGTAGIYVVDGATSQVLVNINGEKSLKPASNNKLLTTAAGLFLLGPDYRFKTTVLGAGPISDGVLNGNLVVRGGGDPTISGRFEPNKRDVTATFRRWAEALTSAGIQRISGDIVADETFFDDNYFHSAWHGGERGEWYSAEVSALAFNDNCVDLSWSGKDKVPGDPADFRMNPVTNYIQLDHHVRVVAGGRHSERYYNRPPVLNDILASGTITVDTIAEDSTAVHDGALYTVTVFRDVLSGQGIQVSGRARKLTAALDATATLHQIFEHPSPPLTEVINIINQNSQNLYAECLLKALGRTQLGVGSFQAGASVVEDFMSTMGVFHKGHVMIDGSGLSSRNQVSPRQLVEVIQAADQEPTRNVWRNSLPIGRTRGSLRTRFDATLESKTLASRIMGKTGTIGGVRSLSGIIVKPGAAAPLYYSLLLNSYKVRDSEAVNILDELAVALARD